MSNNIFPLNDNGETFTPDEFAKQREAVGRKILDAAARARVAEAQARAARRERDNIIRSYVTIYGGTTAEAGRLASIDRTAVSKIVHTKNHSK